MFPEVSANLDSELRELRTIYFTLKEEHQQLEEKMKFFSKVCTIKTHTNCPLTHTHTHTHTNTGKQH